ncbi:hypothetical protein BGW80DRAFT_1466931 [Lactifluus volemus]|nr:hypothetical protein BGW80DRAFT_1466931 [Lactifluus volemus]
MVDMGAGVGSVGALLAHKTDDARSMSRGIAILETMVQRGGNMCHDAVQTLCWLVSAPRGLEPLTKQEQEEEDNEGEEEGREWEWVKLLPAHLFSADPGLLSVDFTSLSDEVCLVLKQTPTMADMRALSTTELWMPDVMDGLIRVWRTALTQVCLSSDAELPPELVQSWHGLLKAALRTSNDDNNENDSMSKLAVLAVSLMQSILSDPKVQLMPSGDAPTSAVNGPAPTAPPSSDVELAPHTRSNAAMKLAVVRALWTHVHVMLPTEALKPEIVWETDTPHDARTQWAMLCAEVIMRSAPSPSSSSSTLLLRVFWGGASSRRRTWDWPADVRTLVWRTFAER